MRRDKYNLTKEELRRYNRKKEQQRVYLILAGMIAGILLILGGIGFGIFQLVHKEPVEEPLIAEEVKTIETPASALDDQTESIVKPDGTDKTEDTAIEIEVQTTIEDSESSDPELEKKSDEEEKKAALDEIINGYISNMTLEEKVAGLFIVEPSQLVNQGTVTAAGSEMDAALKKYPVGGILLAESNLEDGKQLKDMIFNIKTSAQNEIFIAVAETGGEDSIFIKKGLSDNIISDPASIGESGDNSEAYKAGIAISNLLNGYGINMVIGPIADISYSANSYTAKKSYGSDPEQVRGMIRNALHGEVDQNMNVCIGYFPGYGDITASPSGSRPVSSRTKEDIIENEYPIYKDIIDGGAKFIMVSQVAYKSITIDVPACLSSDVVTDMVRGELGYDGVIVTDYMNTHSLVQHYKHADAAVRAIEAGCDIIFMPGNFSKAYNGILDAVKSGQISEERIDESLRRIYRVKYEKIVN